MWLAKEKAYLQVRLRCAALLEIALSAPLDREVILMTLLPMLRSIRALERSISGAVPITQQRSEAVQHLLKNKHSVNVWSLLRLWTAAPKSMMPVRRAKENQ